jgi:hypothetical protein
LIHAPALEVVPWLTFPLLVRFATGYRYHFVLGAILCAAGMFYRPLRRMPTYWFALAVIQGMGIYLTWYAADNHKYLMAYWCLALGCVLAVPQERQKTVLIVNARLLLGLCMGFAVAWKVLTPSFVDGSFFRLRLVSDERFQYPACCLGDIPQETWSESLRQQRQVPTGYLEGDPVDTVQLPDSPRLRALAALMTWWTLAIEGSLALLFLWPGRTAQIQRLRDGLLLMFICSTYALAPVIPFGWVLVILGLAQAPEGSRAVRAAYLGAFLLIPAYTLRFPGGLYALVSC